MDLRELEAALAVFAAMEPANFPVHHVQLFCLVARAGSMSFPEIGRELGLASSSVSRSVAALSETNRHGDGGHNLLSTMRDPDEGRRFIAVLTPRGRAVARQLELI